MAGESDDAVALARGLVLDALRNPCAVPGLPPMQLDLTLRLVRRARLLGRLAARLGQAGMLEMQPQVAADQLQSALATSEARARSARWELNRLDWALDDLRDVPLVVMKGCAYLLAGTPNADGRTFADVDLLVPEADLSRVEMRLRERGWVGKALTPYDDLYYRRWTHELPPMTHVEREVEVDLHHSILMRTARLKPAPAMLFEAARQVPGSRYKVLAPVDMVLHSIVHLFYGGEMDDALRELVDIDDLLRHFSASEPGFWKEFWPRAEMLDLARPAYYGLRYARVLLGTPVPDSALAAALAGAPPAPVLWLMDRLLPRAIFPQHPDHPDRNTDVARLFLYMRSHWIKMPFLMLARHLAFKFYIRRLKRVPDEPTA
jgi:hypothetical protein